MLFPWVFPSIFPLQCPESSTGGQGRVGGGHPAVLRHPGGMERFRVARGARWGQGAPTSGAWWGLVGGVESMRCWRKTWENSGRCEIYHLVGGLEHQFYFPINIGFLIIPIDELIFFRGVAQPPTSHGLVQNWWVWFWSCFLGDPKGDLFWSGIRNRPPARSQRKGVEMGWI